MTPRILLIFKVLTAAATVRAGYKGSTIICMCSTSQCVEHGMLTCKTTGMCFTQYLDRGDGSQPVIRGCIASKTPLLCENRRPAIAEGSWPVLLCCNSNFCNRDVMPTVPSLVRPAQDRIAEKQNDTGIFRTAEEDETVPGYVITDRKTFEDLVANSSHEQDAQQPNPDDEDTSSNKRRKSRHSRFLSQVDPAILGLLACCVVGACVLAIIMRGRNIRFYSDH